MIDLVLRRGAHRAAGGHPWVFAGELEQLPGSGAEQARLYDARGTFLGSGLVNAASQIVWRRYSYFDIPCDEALLRQNLVQAIAWRERFAPGPARRLVWSESDALPGLIVDQYGRILVVQTLTLGMDRLLPVIVGLLQELLAPRAIIARNDAPVRRLEGLEQKVEVLAGDAAGGETIVLDGISFEIDPLHAQKTGFYLDQREQYRLVAAHAPGGRVLDTFCNQGAFALAAARAGALSVTAVDSSEPAILQARANAGRNGFGQIEFAVDNVFDYFRHQGERKWDVVVLDPPPFAPSKRHLAGALRGYKELNLRAARALDRGGVLATYSCSHHVDHETFFSMLREALADAGRSARILAATHQPADHPVLLAMPESEYLRGAILRLD